METHRKIDISFKNAMELYNSGNKALSELATKSFSKSELETTYEDIKTLEDACERLGRDYGTVMRCANCIADFSKSSAAMFKLNLVRDALNLGYDLSLTKCPKNSHFYYPHNPISAKSSTYFNLNKMEVIGKIKSEEEEYYIFLLRT